MKRKPKTKPAAAPPPPAARPFDMVDYTSGYKEGYRQALLKCDGGIMRSDGRPACVEQYSHGYADGYRELNELLHTRGVFAGIETGLSSLNEVARLLEDLNRRVENAAYDERKKREGFTGNPQPQPVD